MPAGPPSPLQAQPTHGFVEKTAAFAEFKKGLATIALGGAHFGSAMPEMLEAVPEAALSGSAPEPLTSREREVLQRVAKGHSTRKIAAKLAISAKTADNHHTHLMRRLDIHDVASLTRHALEQGLVTERVPGYFPS